MVNYSNGKIYKIEPINGEEGEIYIGSTTKKLLSQRMSKHRSEYNGWLNSKNTKTTSFDLFDKYGINNCKIILLELVNAKSKDELISREAFYIRSLECVNKVIPDRTTEEYKKTYYENNKENIKNRVNEYRKNNSKIIKERKTNYYENNKEKINEKRKENRKLDFTCDCGSICKLSHKSDHFKTKKHQEFIFKIESSAVPC
jgi:hypothetical protein